MTSPMQVIVPITKDMWPRLRYGAARRALAIPNYLLELMEVDISDVSDFRLETMAAQLLGPPEQTHSEEDDLPRGNQMSRAEKERALALLAEGICPKTVAVRLKVSAPTIYRIRHQAAVKKGRRRKAAR